VLRAAEPFIVGVDLEVAQAEEPADRPGEVAVIHLQAPADPAELEDTVAQIIQVAMEEDVDVKVPGAELGVGRGIKESFRDHPGSWVDPS
jgi:hypothetical protein